MDTVSDKTVTDDEIIRGQIRSSGIFCIKRLDTQRERKNGKEMSEEIKTPDDLTLFETLRFLLFCNP